MPAANRIANAVVRRLEIGDNDAMATPPPRPGCPPTKRKLSVDNGLLLSAIALHLAWGSSPRPVRGYTEGRNGSQPVLRIAYTGKHDPIAGSSGPLRASASSSSELPYRVLPGASMPDVLGAFVASKTLYLAAPAMAVLAERDVATESSRPNVASQVPRGASSPREQVTLSS
jgi:hypothetical protein